MAALNVWNLFKRFIFSLILNVIFHSQFDFGKELKKSHGAKFKEYSEKEHVIKCFYLTKACYIKSTKC